MNKTNTKYTYATFATDVIALLNGEIEVTPELRENMRNKASDLLEAQLKKAEYNATHKSSRTPKGASEDTKAKTAAIAKVLTAEPMTTAEINTALGTAFTALQVANAVKYIPNIKTCKVIRDSVNSKGLKAQKEYTGYFVG